MKIIVLFKTHLDIGFTDFSANVVKKYNEIYIPQAIRVAEEIAQIGRSEGFVWIVGSWLVAQYLESADEAQKDRLCDAIRKGWVSWHGLPFTMHSEICSAELYEYGLSISKDLDRRFGKTTTGAKCTDVPGHTAAVIPHLADNGIKLLHIGVNAASASVEVPSVFRWRFAGKEIFVMYNGGDYGEFTQIPGTDTYVYFAHTNDNLGPQSTDEIVRIYNGIYAEYPQATVVAGTLNDVAEAVAEIGDALPVIEGEMGDTWIHGAGTDPQKVSQYKALLRYCKTIDETQKSALYRHLVLIPEHTWGMDEKTFLHENENYIRPLFDGARNNYNYKLMELSWAEQRKYALDAAACIEDRAAAKALMNEWHTEFPDLKALTPVEGSCADVNGMSVAFSETGAITFLSYPEAGISLEHCSLFGFSYDEYSYDEIMCFDEQYIKQPFLDDFKNYGNINWAINDFGKYGLQHERNEHTTSEPMGLRLYRDADSLYVLLQLDKAVIANHGLPHQGLLRILPRKDSIEFDFSWYNKPANRAPEALWLSFNPHQKLRGISKLGHIIDPANILPKGGKGLHATDGRVIFDDVIVEPVDSLLVSVGRKNVYHFETGEPNVENGVFFSLFNNQWGTNFPMWNEGNSRFRFILTAAKAE